MLLVSQRLDAPRMDPILPGSVKRKLATDEGLRGVNGVSSSSMTSGSSKRPCLEDVTLSMGPGLQHTPFSSGSGAGGHGPMLEGNGLNHNGLGSPYSMPPKASPGSMAGGAMLPSFSSSGGGNTAPTVEQELQDLLDELTKNPDPSITELDIEKILENKGEEQVSSTGGFVHPEGGAGTPKRSPQTPSHLENHLTHSPGFSQAPPVGTSQVGPPPAGAPYSLPHPAKAVPSPLSASALSSSSSQSHAQGQARSPMLSAALSGRSAPLWPEMSRAQQLQQMASNNKLMSSGTGPTPSQPAPPPAAPQASSWTGPTPPYRPGEKLPSSSPHQQPFSPAGSTQSPQGSLISSMVPPPAKGPSPPYCPEKLASPALAQPPFSPQGVQSSQAPVLTGVPPSSSARPSPPYRPDKRPSPALQHPPPPHSFSSQSEAAGMGSQLFKVMTSSQSSSLKLLMQQQSQPGTPSQAQAQPSSLGKAGTAQDPYCFTNTKPLRHYDPVVPSQNLNHMVPGQGSLSHYAPSSMQQAPAPGVGSAPSQLLQQQEMQQRVQRSMQAGAMVPVNRVDQSSGIVSRPQEPPPMPCQAQGSNYNLILKNQLMQKQLLQEKQRQMEQMNGSQVPECHQVAPFHSGGRPCPTECGYPVGAPPANATMISHGAMLPGRMAVPQGHHSQAGRTPGALMAAPGQKQVLYHPSHVSEIGMPMRPGQGMMSIQARPPAHHMSARAGMQSTAFPGASLQSPQAQHLRHALQQGGAVPRMVFSPQQQQQGLPRMACDAHMDPGLQQQPPQFAQPPVRCGMPGNIGPHQTGAPPPNQIVPGFPNRHIGKISTVHPLSTVGPVGIRPRGPLSAMAGMKPVPPGMVHSTRSIVPPSYPSSVGSHTAGVAYSGGSSGHKLTPCEYTHHQNNGLMADGVGVGRSGEVDFIDTLVGSNEDWLNNLTMIDEYLEQNS